MLPLSSMSRLRHITTTSFALPFWACTVLLLSHRGFAIEKNAADYYVQSLPGQPDGPLLTMHAG